MKAFVDGSLLIKLVHNPILSKCQVKEWSSAKGNHNLVKGNRNKLTTLEVGN